MPKQNRKRKHDTQPNDVEYEILAPKNKFKPFDEQAQAEEEQLSMILFGGASSFLKSLEEAEQENVSAPMVSTPDSGVVEDDSDDSEDRCRKPAWMDEDDDGIEVGHALDAQGRRLPRGGINERSNQYSKLLKHKFETVVGTPSWAALKKSRDYASDSDDEILQTCGFIKKTVKQNLPQTTIEFKKVKDLNSETLSEGIINCVEFHPKSTAALVAGNSGIVSLFAVDGKRNSKLHSIAFERFPILCAYFAHDGNEAVLGSRQSHIYSYDLMAAKAIKVPLPHGLTQCKKFVLSPDSKFMAVAGKWGEVHILASRTKERMGLLKQDNDVTALAFSPSGNVLYGHSNTGEVTVWDMNMGRVRHKWIDEGCLQGSTLSVSSSNQFIAAGSTQGIVNLYGVDDVLQNNLPKPRKTVFNLTTAISDLKFNSSSETFAFCSTDIENSVRLFHVGSGTVFSNFPPFGTKLGHISAINFSPGSGYIAFGNKKSVVSLYRLKHFKNY